MKYKLIALLCCLSLLLGACGNSDDKKAAELNEQANTHYSNGDLGSSITVYEKSLDLKEDAVIRQKLTNIKKEADAVQEVKEFLEALKEAHLSLYQAASYNDFITTGEKIETIIDKLPRVSSPQETEIHNYLSNLESNFDFFNIKTKVGMWMIETKLALPSDDDTSRFSEVLDSLDTFLKKQPLPEFYK